ncbi:hypothetical protein Tco_0885639, partial [Tanacetum coccineum]
MVRDGKASRRCENGKKRQENQQKNQGRNQPEKRQRAARNYGVAAQESKKSKVKEIILGLKLNLD